MLLLVETAAGYGLMKVKDGVMEQAEDLHSDFDTLEKAQKVRLALTAAAPRSRRPAQLTQPCPRSFFALAAGQAEGVQQI